MRVGISTACFYPQPLEEILPVLAGLGVRAVEIFFNTESEFQPRFYERLGAQAKSLGLDVVSVHPYTSLMEGMLLFSDYKRRTEDGMEQYQPLSGMRGRAGRTLSDLSRGARDGPARTRPARWARKCEDYRRLCSLASSCGVTLAQENVAWCRSRDPAFLAALYRDVPELRYTLDIKQAYRAGKNWRDVRGCGGRPSGQRAHQRFCRRAELLAAGRGQHGLCCVFLRPARRGIRRAHADRGIPLELCRGGGTGARGAPAVAGLRRLDPWHGHKMVGILWGKVDFDAQAVV